MGGHLCEEKTKGAPVQYPVGHLTIPCPLESGDLNHSTTTPWTRSVRKAILGWPFIQRRMGPFMPYKLGLVICELRNCEWVFCELKCELARNWSAIFRTTRSLPSANAIAHSTNLRIGNKTCILAHTTRVYV